MTSQEVYIDIVHFDSKEAYAYLKEHSLRYIQYKWTINNDSVEAEELFQEAFVKLFAALKSKESFDGNILNYFFKICYCILCTRTKRNKITYVSDYAQYESVDLDCIIEHFNQVQNIINQLPQSKAKTVLIEYYQNSLSHKEIAQQLNIPYDHVRKSLYKAIKKLKTITPKNIL